MKKFREFARDYLNHISTTKDLERKLQEIGEECGKTCDNRKAMLLCYEIEKNSHENNRKKVVEYLEDFMNDECGKLPDIARKILEKHDLFVGYRKGKFVIIRVIDGMCTQI